MRGTEEIAVRSESWSRAEILVLKSLGMAVFSFLTVLSAQIRIPLPFTPIPMTLQTFVVPLAGGFLGAAWGSASMFLYLVIGLAGVPVFASASSGSHLLYSPSAGYLAGFILAAAIVGYAKDRHNTPSWLFAALLASHLVIFTCGVVGFMWNSGVSLQEAMEKGVYPFLIGDTLKIAASFLVLISYRHFRRHTNL